MLHNHVTMHNFDLLEFCNHATFVDKDCQESQVDSEKDFSLNIHSLVEKQSCSEAINDLSSSVSARFRTKGLSICSLAPSHTVGKDGVLHTGPDLWNQPRLTVIRTWIMDRWYRKLTQRKRVTAQVRKRCRSSWHCLCLLQYEDSFEVKLCASSASRREGDGITTQTKTIETGNPNLHREFKPQSASWWDFCETNTPVKHSVKPLFCDTLVGHSCRTLDSGAPARHSTQTLFRNTVARHFCKTLLLDAY